MNTIESRWEAFDKRIHTASGAQRTVMRIAYYAGALDTLKLLYRLVEKQFSEEADIAVLENLLREADHFLTNLDGPQAANTNDYA